MSLQMPLFEKAGTQAKKTGPSLAEEVVGQGFAVSKFVDSFDALVDALGSSSALRRLILDLAVRGRLTSPAGAATAEEGPFPIPEHWAWGRGEDVFAFVTSGSRGWAAYYSDTGPIFLRIGNLDYETIDLDLRSLQHVQPPKNAEGVRTRVEAGDILISITGDTGMVGLVPPNLGEAYINQHIALARPGAKLLPAFIARALTAPSLLGRLQSAQRGIKNSLGLDDVRKLVVPLPPLAEQKRIVARVDELMALIDDLEAKQTKKREVSARFTKASLEALTTAESPDEFDAVWKRVVENWDTAFNASERVEELRELILWLALSGRLDDSRSSSAWQDSSLGELADLVTSGSRGWKEFYAPSGAIFIRSQDIKTDALDLTSPAFVALPAKAEGRRTFVQRNDLLVTITGANVGKAAHVVQDVPEAYVSQHVALIRLKEPRNAPWVHQWLVSPRNGRKALSRFSYGDKPGLNLDNIKRVPIRVPPLAEQKRIVAKVEHLMRLCDDLEAKLCRAEDRASKLVEAVVQEMVA